MGIEIKHKLVSLAADDPRPGVINPSNWNEAHEIALSGALALLDSQAPAPDRIPYYVDAGTAALTVLTAYIRTLLAADNIGAALAVLTAAPLNAPDFTGEPKAQTPPPGDNSRRLATTEFVTVALGTGYEAYVDAAIAAVIGAAPGSLDTLDELAAALNDNPAQITDILTALGKRLRFDAAQSLTGPEQSQARTNLGLGSAATATLGNAAGNALLLNGSGKVPASNLDAGSILHIWDQKAGGVSGGSFTSGAWRTRDLNTSHVNTITGASLGTNTFTLPAGTFDIEASAPGFSVLRHKAKLRNVTAGTDTLIGTAEMAVTNCQTRSLINGRFTLAAPATFEIQHQCSSTMATWGFGCDDEPGGTGYGVIGKFTEAKIIKV